jgi:hypothetical protein
MAVAGSFNESAFGLTPNPAPSVPGSRDRRRPGSGGRGRDDAAAEIEDQETQGSERGLDPTPKIHRYSMLPAIWTMPACRS